MSITDSDTTLGDLNIHDRDNFTHMIHTRGKTFRFPDSDTATMFMATCVDKALRKLGVKIRPGMGAGRIDRLMKSRGVKMEHRKYSEEAELERAGKDGDEPRKTGFFFYTNHEIAAYVSNPFFRVSDLDLLPAFYVLTTTEKEKVYSHATENAGG